MNFVRVSSFPICSFIDKDCNTDNVTVAEIVAVTEDGMTLVYTDSELGQVGFVDIKDPSNPKGIATVDVEGEPTSVAVLGPYALVAVNTSPDFVNPTGVLQVIDIHSLHIVRSIDLGGQPDSIAISPDGKYAAVAIENERDEDFGDGRPPQAPPGFLAIVDTSSDDPDHWTVHNVDLTYLDGVLFPEDPEPEYVSINSKNQVVVTLQENNGIVLVDLEHKTVIKSFSSGAVDLKDIDTMEDGIIDQSMSLDKVLREPDGVVWINDHVFATADEGDLDGGSRGFTIWDADKGEPIYESSNELELLVAAVGHYPEERSEAKGNEPENVAYGKYGDDEYLFVNSERSNAVFVYDIKDIYKPVFKQVLPAGVGPEGALAIPSRNLYVAASETDSREEKIRSVLNIYELKKSAVRYPTLLSSGTRENGTPIPFGALSGLAAETRVKGSTIVYSIEDSFYKKNRIFTIDAGKDIPELIEETRITDSDGVLAGLHVPIGEFNETELQALINDDQTVNIDPEGIAIRKEGGFWLVSEGSGTVGDPDRPITSLNFLFHIDEHGVIKTVILLPDEVNEIQSRFGFEGVAEDGDYVVVVFQRAWGDEPQPRIGAYNKHSKEWTFAYYPLDEPLSNNGGWVGLSDIAPLGDGKFLVVERDDQGGPDGVIKKLYSIELDYHKFGKEPENTIEKHLVRDLVPDLLTFNGLLVEKVEGVTVTETGDVWIVNDNDGIALEILMINLGDIL
jgi:DNA-binding beta-propeller fold protein YncE